MHEQRAKDILAARIAHLESPSHKKAHLHMWTAVAMCSAVFIAAYAFVASKTYQFAEVKASIAHAAEQVKDVGEKLAPLAEEPKAAWNEMQGNIVEEMKKNIGASDTLALPKAESKPTTN